MVQKKVEGARLDTPIDLSDPPVEPEREEYVVDVVLRYLAAAKNPVILVDACAVRHRVLKETHDLIQNSNLPVFVTPMAKSAVDETLPNYGGVYAGDGSNAGVRERLESADLILSIGAIKSDFNTTGFTYRIGQLKTIDFHSNMMRVRYSEYPGVRMKGVLRKVTDRLPKLNVEAAPPVSQNTIPNEEKGIAKESTISHAWFWPRFGQWLKEDDIVITETGTANFGIWETRFPKGVLALSQVLWGSIGYSVGACQGAALAAKETETKGRTLLFVGDGSLQLTAQEISTMIRHDLNPIIFCICNEGYTIERYIHGMDASYNDVQEWKYKDLVPTFGAKSDRYKTYQVKTRQELENLFHDDTFVSAPYLQFVELYMPKEDAPAALKVTAEASARTNAKM